jgi:hypothetical protein
MSGLFGGGGGGDIQAPKAPKPIQINLNDLAQQMSAADYASFNQQDQFMQQYYPDLWTAQQNMIKNAYMNLTGPLSPALQNTFVNNANMQSIQSLGGGDQGFGLAKGSLARNAAAANVASDQQGYEDYNRAMFENLNSMFSPRSFGMTPEDAANIFTFNNTQYNNYLQQQYGLDVNAYYQNQAQSAQSGASGLNFIMQIVGAAASAY